MKIQPRKSLTYAILSRVSTREQRSGHSLDIQIELGRNYAEKNGATTILEYKGVESATGEQRDILESALLDAENGKFVALIVQDLTRLSRNPAVMFAAISRLSKCGVMLHDLNGPIPFETPEGEFRVLIESAVGRYTARQSTQKSINARVRIIDSGGIAAGRPPWGRKWNKHKKQLEIIPEKKQLLQDVYRLIVKHNKSLNKVAAELKIATSSLRKAIFQSSLKEITQRLSGHQATIPCPMLLTTAQQFAIERRLDENRVIRPKLKGQYLLQGLVRCAACGATMSGQKSTKDGKSYAVYRHPPSRYKQGCVWQIPVSLLDDDILSICANTISDGDSLRQAIEAAVADKNSEAIDINERLQQTELDFKQSNNRLEKLIDRISMFDEGSETLKRLKIRATKEEQTLAQLKLERNELVNQANLITISNEAMDDIIAKVRTLYWKHGAAHDRLLSFEQRKEFVQAIVGKPTTKEKSTGIFVRMIRAKGASKKNVRWTYKLIGALAIASNSLHRHTDDPPELITVKAHSAEQVKALAVIAKATIGVKPHHVPLRKKYSSNGLPRCA